MSERDFSVTRQAVISEIAQLAREKYVFAELGEQIAARLEAGLRDGSYEDAATPNELAARLTVELQSISSDRHWAVIHDPVGAAEQVDPESETDGARLARYREMARRANFGFERVERLEGNIGYLDQRYLFPSEYGGETAVAAMNFVSQCDALIIDLRRNHGGYPSMVQLITSYLVEPEPQHINTFFYRPTNDTQQFWTFPHVPGRRRPDILVYVLISGATGSGAEELAYDLKHMQRAKLVGETTVGAAHPVTREVVQGNYTVRLPYGRPINPITGSNWEVKGVEPHIRVPAEEALKTAHLEALQQLAAQCKDETHRAYLTWIDEIVASHYSPVTLGSAELARCTGEFGVREFSVEAGELIYTHRELKVSWKLAPISGTRFHLDGDLKFEFALDPDGRAIMVTIRYRDGRTDLVAARTG